MGVDLGVGMIDWERVKELRSEIGAEDFDEVVGLFLEEAEQVLARLSLDAGAMSLAADLHFLKGAALNLGFAALSVLCQDGERRANAGDLSVDLAGLRATYLACRESFALGAAAAFAA
jgi:HPt (histidine-containing phosphotransfer) domain-containing protein